MELSRVRAHPPADTSLDPVPPGADEDALIMPSDILPTCSESVFSTAKCNLAGPLPSSAPNLSLGCAAHGAVLFDSGYRPRRESVAGSKRCGTTNTVQGTIRALRWLGPFAHRVLLQLDHRHHQRSALRVFT